MGKSKTRIISRRRKLPSGYPRFLADVKTKIQEAQLKASLSANQQLIQLYWYIGQRIVQRQEREGWGRSIIEQLATDLGRSFPGVQGFSSRNLWRMRAFYLAYAQGSKTATAVAEFDSKNAPKILGDIPWGQNMILLEKLKNSSQRLWYANKTMEYGWSRSVLWHQIESKLFERQGKKGKLANFSKTLPPLQSDLAMQMVKDPYNFDFLTLSKDAHERDMERGLLDHIRKFLLELGTGFSFVGNQYHLSVGDEDFYIDLLFYHLRLRCFVIIDLKMDKFRPEYAGKMNFYLTAIDRQVRHPQDAPSIGLILCKTKNKLVVEYALSDSKKPIGVSSYKITETLPSRLKGKLPTIREIESELKKDSKARK